MSGLESLAAAAGVGGGGVGSADPSGGKKGKKFFKALGFGSSKQEEADDFTHMRCGSLLFLCVFSSWCWSCCWYW